MVGGGRGAFIGAVHRFAARLDDRWELVAGALSSDPARARASGEDLGLVPARTYESALAMADGERGRQDGIDAVAIVTPNYAHAAAARAFLEAGIHVICEKPMATSSAEAEQLAALAHARGLIFAVTHNYTGYPLVRQARQMVQTGCLGQVRVVQVEYAQDWLATPLEGSGQKQAAWRTDPARAGPAGAVGDIGTHALNLAEFVVAKPVESLAADLHTFVGGRALDDNAHILLRFSCGAKGMLWCSQVAPGNENNLRLRVYGDKGGLEWNQQEPNVLSHTAIGEPTRLIRRGGPGTGEAARAATRIPSGHPEGFLEGFAQLYRDVAEQIHARIEDREPDPLSLQVADASAGVRGMRFIEAAVHSSLAGATWVLV